MTVFKIQTTHLISCEHRLSPGWYNTTYRFLVLIDQSSTFFKFVFTVLIITIPIYEK